MNLQCPPPTDVSQLLDHQHKIATGDNVQKVIPISPLRRDILLSSSNESSSQSSLDCSLEMSPPFIPCESPSSLDNVRIVMGRSSLLNSTITITHKEDELRSFNVSMARKLRRIKRRLLLERALVLARGPTDDETRLEDAVPGVREEAPAGGSTTNITSVEPKCIAMPTAIQESSILGLVQDLKSLVVPTYNAIGSEPVTKSSLRHPTTPAA